MLASKLHQPPRCLLNYKMEVVVQTQIQGIFRHRRGHELVNIFGYTSQGMPGIEIIGLGGLGRLIKEKLLFLSKTQSLRFPLKRYVLGVEMVDSAKDFEVEALRWLEFPILLSFWTLCDLLPISKLEDCLASGKVSVSGKIEEPILPSALIAQASNNLKLHGHKYLKIISEFSASSDDIDCRECVHLSSRELLRDVGLFQFEQYQSHGPRSIEAILSESSVVSNYKRIAS